MQSVEILCPDSQLADKAKNPDFRRPQVSLHREQQTALDSGPLPLRCKRCQLVKTCGKTTWLSVNVRAAALGGFHAEKCPFCGEQVEGSEVVQLRNELERERIGAAKLQGELSKMGSTLEEKNKRILVLETDQDPWHPKHGRWNSRMITHPTGQSKEAYREYHEEMSTFIDLKYSSQKKFVSLHFQPRMEALYYLCGADRASFTAALSL